MTLEPPAKGTCLLASAFRQRDVGSTGVSSQPRPFGLAVANQPDVPVVPGWRRHAQDDRSVVSGLAESPGSAAKNARDRQPNNGARRTAGTCPILVL